MILYYVKDRLAPANHFCSHDPSLWMKDYALEEKSEARTRVNRKPRWIVDLVSELCVYPLVGGHTWRRVHAMQIANENARTRGGQSADQTTARTRGKQNADQTSATTRGRPDANLKIVKSRTSPNRLKLLPLKNTGACMQRKHMRTNCSPLTVERLRRCVYLQCFLSYLETNGVCLSSSNQYSGLRKCK